MHLTEKGSSQFLHLVSVVMWSILRLSCMIRWGVCEDWGWIGASVLACGHRHTSTYAQMYACLCTDGCTYICMHACMYVYICMEGDWIRIFRSIGTWQYLGKSSRTIFFESHVFILSLNEIIDALFYSCIYQIFSSFINMIYLRL